MVLANAELKARAGSELAGPDSFVIGVDTDVVLDGTLLGKPSDREGAASGLRMLAGRRH